MIPVRFVSLLALITCVLVPASGPFAQDAKQKEGGAKQGLTDQQFVQKASAGNLAEITLGKLAAEKAGSTDVRKFGQRMVEDHSKANKELLALAGKKGLAVPSAPEPHHKMLADKLSKLQGADFDREYMTHMVKSHEESESLYSKQAKDGQDAELKAFAAKVLPTVKEHLQMAREMAKKGGGAGKDR